MKHQSIVLGVCVGLAGGCGDDSAGRTGSGSASQTGTITATATDSSTDGTDSMTSVSDSAEGSATTTDTTETGSPTTGTTESTTGPTSGPSSDTDASDTDTAGTGTTGGSTVCDPGETTCLSETQFATCVDDGSEFGLPQDCAATQTCLAGQCYAYCDLVEATPSSIGCSFLTAKADNFDSNVNQPEAHDSLTAGNVSSEQTVNAQLYFVPIGGAAEQAVGAAVQIPPQGTYTWVLDTPEIDSQSLLRTGGVYRLETDIPVAAYRHSPISAVATNDSSMLLPEHALTGNYIVASYPATINAYPSYFMALGVQDGTLVDFTVTGATAGGTGVPALAAGGSTQIAMDRYDLLNVVVQQQQGGDLSGTVISATGSLVVLGATECANVPSSSTTFCDHLEEIMLPLEYWGQEYVGAHAPQRGNETYHWRVYAGDDNVTIETNPAQPGFPVTLDQGEFHQFATQQSFMFTGNGPFMPVQYLEGQNGGAGTGDPSMYQMVPVEQFLPSYAFVTGESYTQHYAQIIRPLGGADVFVDGVMVTGYDAVGAYEVADWPVTEGAHFAESEDEFGLIQVGYTGVTSYGYPGGMQLEIINPQ